MGIILLISVIFIAGVGTGLALGFSQVMHKVARERAAKNSWHTRLTLGRILLIMGGLSLVVSLGLGIYDLYFVLAARHAQGTVIRMDSTTEKSNGSAPDTNQRVYAPTFQFQDAAGNQRIVTSGLYSSSPTFHVGDSVPVLYLRSHPQSARIDSFDELWWPALVTAAAGVVFLLIGLAMTRWRSILGWRRRPAGN